MPVIPADRRIVIDVDGERYEWCVHVRNRRSNPHKALLIQPSTGGTRLEIEYQNEFFQSHVPSDDPQAITPAIVAAIIREELRNPTKTDWALRKLLRLPPATEERKRRARRCPADK